MARHIAWYFNGIEWTLNDSIDFHAKKNYYLHKILVNPPVVQNIVYGVYFFHPFVWSTSPNFICLTPPLWWVIFIVSILWDKNKILFIRHIIMMRYIASHLLDWYREWYNVISYFPRFPDVIVKPKIFLTIPWEEVLILRITNKPKLLVLFMEFWFIHTILCIYFKFRGVNRLLKPASRVERLAKW